MRHNALGMRPNIFRILEVLIIGAVLCAVFATLAKAEERQRPVLATHNDCAAGWTPYQTSLSGYDSLLRYQYTRQVFVCVGPVEALPGVSVPELEIRRAIVGVHEINSAPAGRRCDPSAPLYFEYGEELFGSRDCNE